MSLRRVFLTLLLLGLVGLAACGGGGNAQSVTVKATDYRFDPTSVRVKANTPVRLTLQNNGAVTHDWTPQNFPDKVSVIADAGQSKTVEFTPTQKGTYQVICTQPGHADLGMTGELVVE